MTQDQMLFKSVLSQSVEDLRLVTMAISKSRVLNDPFVDEIEELKTGINFTLRMFSGECREYVILNKITWILIGLKQRELVGWLLLEQLQNLVFAMNCYLLDGEVSNG